MRAEGRSPWPSFLSLRCCCLWCNILIARFDTDRREKKREEETMRTQRSMKVAKSLSNSRGTKGKFKSGPKLGTRAPANRRTPALASPSRAPASSPAHIPLDKIKDKRTREVIGISMERYREILDEEAVLKKEKEGLRELIVAPLKAQKVWAVEHEGVTARRVPGKTETVKPELLLSGGVDPQVIREATEVTKWEKLVVTREKGQNQIQEQEEDKR